MTIDVNLSATDLVVGKSNTIDKVDDNKVDGVKLDAKTAKSKSQDKNKDKNLVISFLAKSQPLVQGSESGFLTPRARQAFIEIPILYHFDPDCHIWIKTDISDYVINRVLNWLTLEDLGR